MNGQAEIQHALERLIVGELPAAEAGRMAREAGYRTFADLCEAELPERLPRLRLDRMAVRRRVQQAIQGRLALEELRCWAEELAAVLDRHELGISLLERRRLGESLALTAVATDQRIFRNTAPVLRVLAEIGEALGRRRAGSVASLYGELFFEQPELHLLTRRLDDVEPDEEGEEGEGDEDETGEAGPPTYLPQTPSFLENLGIGNLDLDVGLDRVWHADAEGGPDAKSCGSHPETVAFGRGRESDGLRHADVVALSRPYALGTRVQEY